MKTGKYYLKIPVCVLIYSFFCVSISFAFSFGLTEGGVSSPVAEAGSSADGGSGFSRSTDILWQQEKVQEIEDETAYEFFQNPDNLDYSYSVNGLKELTPAGIPSFEDSYDSRHIPDISPLVYYQYDDIPVTVSIPADIDALINLLDPAVSTGYEIDQTLSILGILTNSYYVRGPDEEKIALAVLPVVTSEDAPIELKTKAVSQVLYNAVVDVDVSGQVKEDIARALLPVMSMPVEDEDTTEFKQVSIIVLRRIASDDDVSSSVKESMAEPVIDLVDKEEYAISALNILNSVCEDSDVSIELKEYLIGFFVEKVQAYASENSGEIVLPLRGISVLMSDERVDSASKAALVEPLLSLLEDTGVDAENKYYAFSSLVRIVKYCSEELDSEEKKDILYACMGFQTPDSDTGLLMEYNKWELAKIIFMDRNMSSLFKEINSSRILDYLGPQEEIESRWDVYFINQQIACLGGIVTDPEVSFLVKEAMITPLQDFITRNLERMYESLSFYEMMVDAFGVMITIMNDNGLSTGLKTGIKDWIGGLDIFTNETRSVWNRDNVLIFAVSGGYLSPGIINSIDNVLDCLPFEKGAHVISLEDSDGSSFDKSSTGISIGIYDGMSFYSLEKSLFNTILFFQEFTGGISSELIDDMTILWQSSDAVFDFAHPSGYGRFLSEFNALGGAYFTDTRGLIDQAVFLASNPIVNDPTLLAKCSLFARIFTHEREFSGEIIQCAYVYMVDKSKGLIVRMEVGLETLRINADSYIVPDFNNVYETNIFN